MPRSPRRANRFRTVAALYMLAAAAVSPAAPQTADSVSRPVSPMLPAITTNQVQPQGLFQGAQTDDASGQSPDRNDIPSCLHYAKLDAYAQPPTHRELVLAIDRTVALGDELRRGALTTSLRFIMPGDEVLIYEFSAYTKIDHLRLVFRGHLDNKIPEHTRNSIGMDDLRAFDACVPKQAQFFQALFEKVFNASMGREGADFENSDILYSLQAIAMQLHSRRVDHRVILVISDMLENSDFDSFYQSNRVRQIDPRAELAKVKDRGLLADFDGAHVYIHGTGLIDPGAKKNYQAGSTVDALKSFWIDYFTESHAVVDAVGTPDLGVDLH